MDSGRPGPTACGQWERSGEGRALGEAPTALQPPLRRTVGRRHGRVVSATAGARAAPPTRTPFLSLPSPLASSHALQAQKRRRKRAHLELSRGAVGARGAAASLAAAARRGFAEKAPFSGAARACSPAAPQPLSVPGPRPPSSPRRG